MSFVATSAPLATQFQSCLAAIQALYAALVARGEDRADKPGAQLCKEELGRLNLWDVDVHASSGELDHSLRKTPQLWKHVFDLLGQLTEAVRNG